MIAVYKEIDKRYTMSEYCALKDKFEKSSSYSVLEYALRSFLSGELVRVKKTTDPSNPCTSICIPTEPHRISDREDMYCNFSEWLSDHSQKAYKLLYEVSFDMVPLYINGSAYETIIAAWRLEIGK